MMAYLNNLFLFVEQWLGSLSEVAIVFFGVSAGVLCVVAFWERLIRLPETIAGVLLALSLVFHQQIMRFLYFLPISSSFHYLLMTGPLLVVILYARNMATGKINRKLFYVIVSLFIPALLLILFPDLLNQYFVRTGLVYEVAPAGFSLLFLSVLLIAVMLREHEVKREMVTQVAAGEALSSAERRATRGTKIGAPLVIVISTLAVFISGSFSPEPMVGDEVTHYFMLTKQAEDISQPNFYSHIPFADGDIEVRRYPHSFLWHYLGAVIYRLSGDSFYAVQIFQAVFLFQLLFVAYLMAYHRGGVETRSALVYLLAVASLPITLTFSVLFYQDIPMAAQVITAFYLLDRRKWLWAALFMALAMGFKVTAVLFFPPFFLLLAYRLFVHETSGKGTVILFCSILAVFGSTWSMGKAINVYAHSTFYPQEQLEKLVDIARDKANHFFIRSTSPLPDKKQKLDSGKAKPAGISGGRSNKETAPVIIANHPGDLRIKINYLIYGGVVLWIVITGALVGTLFGTLEDKVHKERRNKAPEMWLWLTGGFYIVLTAFLISSAPDARFFLPGLVFILLPIAERFVRLPKPKIIISIVAILALLQGGYVLAKTYRLRSVSQGLLEAIEYLSPNPPQPKRVFMYPEGNYRLFPVYHEWYLGYRLREFWRADNKQRSLLQNSDQICRSDDEFDDKKGRNILK